MGGGGTPCDVVLLVPISDRSAPFATAGPSEVRGRPSAVFVAAPEFCESGHDFSLTLGTVFGVLRRCNLGLFGEFCAELIRGPMTGRSILFVVFVVGEFGPVAAVGNASVFDRSCRLVLVARPSVSVV